MNGPSMLDLLCGDTALVSWKPNGVASSLDSRMEVRVSLFLGEIPDVRSILEGEASSQLGIGLVFLGLEEAGNDTSRLGLGVAVRERLLVFSAADGLGVLARALLEAEQLFLLDLQVLGKIGKERLDRCAEGDVEEDGENEEDDLQNQRAECLLDTKETDQADFAEIDTGKSLVKRTGIYKPLGINRNVVNKEEVVTVCKVEESQANSSECHNERGNHGVSESDDCDVGIHWEYSSPSQSGEGSPASELLTGSVVEDGPKDAVQKEADELEERGRRNRETLQNHERNVEVGSLGQVLSEKSSDGSGIIDNLGDRRRSRGGECRDEEHLDDLEEEVSVLHTELNGGKRRAARDPSEHLRNSQSKPSKEIR